MNEITMPDFEEIALRIFEHFENTPQPFNSIVEEVRLTFNQGYHYGLNKGWIVEQENNNNSQSEFHKYKYPSGE